MVNLRRLKIKAACLFFSAGMLVFANASYNFNYSVQGDAAGRILFFFKFRMYYSVSGSVVLVPTLDVLIARQHEPLIAVRLPVQLEI